jgi:hypothetical protein
VQPSPPCSSKCTDSETREAARANCIYSPAALDRSKLDWKLCLDYLGAQCSATAVRSVVCVHGCSNTRTKGSDTLFRNARLISRAQAAFNMTPSWSKLRCRTVAGDLLGGNLMQSEIDMLPLSVYRASMSHDVLDPSTPLCRFPGALDPVARSPASSMLVGGVDCCSCRLLGGFQLQRDQHDPPRPCMVHISRDILATDWASRRTQPFRRRQAAYVWKLAPRGCHGMTSGV